MSESVGPIPENSVYSGAVQPAADTQEPSQRESASPLTLALTAIGGPRQIAGKLARLARTLSLYVRPAQIDQRLRTLAERGYVSQQPNRLQIVFGSLDMLRFVIEPASRDYYKQKGISFGFHQLLRVLDDPVSMIDPTGFLSDRDTIVGHLMQVVHLNPIYDLQLMQMFPNGLEELESQVQAMLDGSHPRHRTIGAIVEDPDYHARLLEYIRKFRVDPSAAPPRREVVGLADDANYRAAERTFATLPGFIDYCNKLPDDLWSLMKRMRSLEAFPMELAVGPEA